MEKEDNSSEEEYQTESNKSSPEDLETFYKEYEKLKKNYITKPNLNKYEKTKILSERAQQLANGGTSFLQNPEVYDNVQEIAMQELLQKKIPFIIRRPVPNGHEYWKLEDCLL
jgi:DNA-directed RNA polymerase subunit K/omega